MRTDNEAIEMVINNLIKNVEYLCENVDFSESYECENLEQLAQQIHSDLLFLKNQVWKGKICQKQ